MLSTIRIKRLVCFQRILYQVVQVFTIAQIPFGLLVDNKIKKELKYRGIILLLMWTKADLLKRSQRFLSLCLGMVVSNIILAFSIVLLLVVMLLSLPMAGMLWLIRKLESLDLRYGTMPLLMNLSGIQSLLKQILKIS